MYHTVAAAAMFKCPLTSKSNSTAIKSPKTRNFKRQPTLEIASMQSSYMTQNSGVRISISSRVRHLYRGFNTTSACKRLGNGRLSACKRQGPKELSGSSIATTIVLVDSPDSVVFFTSFFLQVSMYFCSCSYIH